MCCSPSTSHKNGIWDNNPKRHVLNHPLSPSSSFPLSSSLSLLLLSLFVSSVTNVFRRRCGLSIWCLVARLSLSSGMYCFALEITPLSTKTIVKIRTPLTVELLQSVKPFCGRYRFHSRLSQLRDHPDLRRQHFSSSTIHSITTTGILSMWTIAG